MERRGFLQFSLLSTLTLALKGPKHLFAFAGPEAIRAPLPKQPWEKVEFSYARGPQVYPGIAVRLPDKPDAAAGLPEIYAACRVCPHQGCLFNYEVDYSKIGDITGSTLNNPVFFCRCHMSIFDPAQKGKVISGPANRPPWSFSLRLDNNELIIEGVEKGVGEFNS